jgi:hypothetical protein
MTDAPHYTGELRKGEKPDTIDAFLEDIWKWRITIRGVRQPDGTYALQAWVGDPGFLRLEIDEVKA